MKASTCSKLESPSAGGGYARLMENGLAGAMKSSSEQGRIGFLGRA